MNFNLIRPCANCPFRTDIPGYLSGARAQEIGNALMQDKTFTCHKTNTYGEDGEASESMKSEHCAGATIMLEKLGRPNQMMRIAERLGIYDMRKLDMTSPVVSSVREFVGVHSGKKKVSAR